MPPGSPLLIETLKDVTVVSFNTSSLIDARIIDAIRDELMHLVEKQAKSRLLLDLSRIVHLSSAALGMLVPLQQAVERRRGILVLCGLRKEIAKVFKVSGLAKLFKIRKDERRGLRDFGVTY